MQTQTLERVYKGLKSGRKVDLTRFIKEGYKEYKDLPNGREEQMTKVTIELAGTADPAFIVSMYVDKKEVESHFYYLDEKDQLKQLLNSWLQL